MSDIGKRLAVAYATAYAAFQAACELDVAGAAGGQLNAHANLYLDRVEGILVCNAHALQSESGAADRAAADFALAVQVLQRTFYGPELAEAARVYREARDRLVAVGSSLVRDVQG